MNCGTMYFHRTNIVYATYLGNPIGSFFTVQKGGEIRFG